VVKTIQAFDSLYLMMASIKSSLSALAWSSVVLLLLEMMLALFLNVMLEDFWEDPANLQEDRQEIYAYFGTFSRSLQTMVEMLLGNWYTITRLLTGKVSEWWVLFGVSHQLIVGFAVIEVITGVFLHQTFQVANMDDGILLNETKREIKDQTEKMLRFFQHADTDGNGSLSKEEFKECLGKDKVQEWMNAMGLDTHQVEKVFTLFDVDKSGTISPEELVAGTLQLKGQAKAMELALVRAMVEDIRDMCKRSFGRKCAGAVRVHDDCEDSVLEDGPPSS
jgi:Ca2+-binding EF-hand superfamily protein